MIKTATIKAKHKKISEMLFKKVLGEQRGLFYCSW